MNESILVDASAVLAVILEEPEKQAILEVTAGCEAKAPGCLRWEIGNAFSRMVKRNRLKERESLAAVAVFETIPVQEVDVNLEAALQLALKHQICAYDAYYLVAAKTHRIGLLTLDGRMSDIAKEEGIKIKEIL